MRDGNYYIKSLSDWNSLHHNNDDNNIFPGERHSHSNIGMKRDAIIVLSEYSMSLFCTQFQKMNSYVVTEEIMNNLVTSIVSRRESDVQFARIIQMGERCGCHDSLSFDIQCVHEMCIDKKFIMEKWGTRHYQEKYYNDNVGYDIREDDFNDNDGGDNDHREEFNENDPDDNDDREEFNDNVSYRRENDEDANDGMSNNSKKFLLESVDQTKRSKNITFKDLMQEFSNVANIV